ncbi:MAG: hypothetical protein EPN93_07915 [Spirochaetes bacterium]|nr:MAG: hypothetical protein EPN93_07915 [Spirochaetota bacterium]
MKTRICLALTALMVLGPITRPLHAFVGQRLDWWDMRLKQVSADRERLAREGAHAALLESMDAEIEVARATLGQFQRSLKGDGSPRYEKRAFTAEELAAETKRLSQPLFSIARLDMLTALPGEKKSIEAVRAASATALRARLAGGTDADELAAAILDEDFFRAALQPLALEAYMARMITARDATLAKYLDGILAKTREGLAAAGGRLSPRELEDLVVDAANAALAEIPATVVMGPDDLPGCPAWHALTARLDSEAALIEKMGALGKDAAQLPPARKRALLKNPADLERTVFGALSSACLARTDIPEVPAEGPARADGVSVKLPPLPMCARFMREADTFRTDAAASITGSEGAEYFDALRKKLLELYARYAKDPLAAIARADEEITQARAKGLGVIDEKEFGLAKDLITAKLGALREYAARSVDYCAWLSQARRTDGARAESLYRERAAEYGRYAQFIRGLIEECAGAAAIDRPPLHRRYALAYARAGELYKAMKHAAGIGKESLRFFSREQAAAVKTAKRDLLRAIEESHIAAAKAHAAFSDARAAATRRTRSAGKDLDASLAQFEVSGLTGLLERQHASLMKLGYAREALPLYAKSYRALREELEGGQTSPVLEKALAAGSLIPGVQGFDAERLKKEYAAKQELRKTLAGLVSRISLLVAFYRQKGVDIRDVPADDCIAGVRNAFTDGTRVEVADWTMNESNFTEVDRNAAAKLILQRNRKLWGKTPAPHDRADTGRKITLESAGVSITLPEGWVERAPDSADARDGVLGRMGSADNRADITVALVPLQGRAMDKACEDWVKGTGGTIVKQRWGNRDGAEYFWTLSSEVGKQVRESYTVAHNGNALIITGSAPRDLYPAFREKLEVVFGSLGGK